MCFCPVSLYCEHLFLGTVWPEGLCLQAFECAVGEVKSEGKGNRVED